MSVLKGLQDLLLKMGGTPVSGDNTDELVRKIAAAYDPATQELPSITSLDKGKYLHTNNDTGALEWAEVSGGGGGVYRIVPTTRLSGMDASWAENPDSIATYFLINETLEEIIAMYNSGVSLEFVVPVDFDYDEGSSDYNKDTYILPLDDVYYRHNDASNNPFTFIFRNSYVGRLPNWPNTDDSESYEASGKAVFLYDFEVDVSRQDMIVDGTTYHTLLNITKKQAVKHDPDAMSGSSVKVVKADVYEDSDTNELYLELGPDDQGNYMTVGNLLDAMSGVGTPNFIPQVIMLVFEYYGGNYTEYFSTRLSHCDGGTPPLFEISDEFSFCNNYKWLEPRDIDDPMYSSKLYFVDAPTPI